MRISWISLYPDNSLYLGSPVERLGMDENWLDITKIIQVRRREQNLTEISLRLVLLA